TNMADSTDDAEVVNRESIGGDPLFAAELGVVAVILMDGSDEGAGIDNGNMLGERLPNHPVIPVAVADDQGRHVEVEALGEKEKVNPIFILLEASGSGELANGVCPGRVGKIDGSGHVGIPTPGDQKEPVSPLASDERSPREVIGEDDIAVGKAEKIVASDLRGAAEHVVEELGAGLVQL